MRQSACVPLYEPKTRLETRMVHPIASPIAFATALIIAACIVVYDCSVFSVVVALNVRRINLWQVKVRPVLLQVTKELLRLAN